MHFPHFSINQELERRGDGGVGMGRDRVAGIQQGHDPKRSCDLNWVEIGFLLSVAMTFAIQDLMPMYWAKHCHSFLDQISPLGDTIKKFSVTNQAIQAPERPISPNVFTEDSTSGHPEKESCSTTFAGPGGQINSLKVMWSQEDTWKFWDTNQCPQPTSLLRESAPITAPDGWFAPCDWYPATEYNRHTRV